MLFILDTDHVSLLQRGHESVQHRLFQIPPDSRAVTVITMTEQLQGWLGTLHRGRTETDVARISARLLETVHYYNRIRVLPYDNMAVTIFETLRRQKVRVGTQDLRIAAITLRWQATLVTRNARDFSRIPSLEFVDWTV
jgi:tRNA(fMet)-specific endonuclease VapC